MQLTLFKDINFSTQVKFMCNHLVKLKLTWGCMCSVTLRLYLIIFIIFIFIIVIVIGFAYYYDVMVISYYSSSILVQLSYSLQRPIIVGAVILTKHQQVRMCLTGLNILSKVVSR